MGMVVGKRVVEGRVVSLPIVESGALLILVWLSGRCRALRTNALI